VIVPNENIRAFDVAVHDFALVQEVQPFQNLLQVVLDLRGGESERP
jgi:hypothetical protein